MFDSIFILTLQIIKCSIKSLSFIYSLNKCIPYQEEFDFWLDFIKFIISS